jgi:TolB protein
VAFVRKADASDDVGELWVLDLSPQLAPVGPPRRLVNPAEVDPSSIARGWTPHISFPRWSPAGDRIAFLKTTPTPAGYLLTAAADTGAVLIPQQPVWANYHYAWAPDGSHIAWIAGRGNPGPATVNVLAVGGTSTPVATGTNASSVFYAKDGQAILFTNGDTSDLNPATFPGFTLRAGGIYSVAAAAETGATPPAPTPLFTKKGWRYGDITALDSGAMAFTAQEDRRGDPSSTVIQVLDTGSSLPRTTVTDVACKPICHETLCDVVRMPVWGAGDFVAIYLDTSAERSLVVTDLDNRSPRRVDTGVDTFAWAPPSR